MARWDRVKRRVRQPPGIAALVNFGVLLLVEFTREGGAPQGHYLLFHTVNIGIVIWWNMVEHEQKGRP